MANKSKENEIGRIMANYAYLGTFIGCVAAAYYLGINTYDKRKLLIGFGIIAIGLYMGSILGTKEVNKKNL